MGSFIPVYMFVNVSIAYECTLGSVCLHVRIAEEGQISDSETSRIFFYFQKTMANNDVKDNLETNTSFRVEIDFQHLNKLRGFDVGEQKQTD